MSACWLESSGEFVVTPGDCRLVVVKDFCEYYKKLILFNIANNPKDFQTPKHGAHITIVSAKIHGFRNTSKVSTFSGVTIPFSYNINIKKGGKQFTTYYVDVVCPFADKVKKTLDVVDSPGFLGLHICIMNNKSKIKNENSNIRNIVDNTCG
jgi:hypothetical protein